VHEQKLYTQMIRILLFAFFLSVTPNEIVGHPDQPSIQHYEGVREFSFRHQGHANFVHPQHSALVEFSAFGQQMRFLLIPDRELVDDHTIVSFLDGEGAILSSEKHEAQAYRGADFVGSMWDDGALDGVFFFEGNWYSIEPRHLHEREMSKAYRQATRGSHMVVYRHSDISFDRAICSDSPPKPPVMLEELRAESIQTLVNEAKDRHGVDVQLGEEEKGTTGEKTKGIIVEGVGSSSADSKSEVDALRRAEGDTTTPQSDSKAGVTDVSDMLVVRSKPKLAKEGSHIGDVQLGEKKKGTTEETSIDSKSEVDALRRAEVDTRAQSDSKAGVTDSFDMMVVRSKPKLAKEGSHIGDGQVGEKKKGTTRKGSTGETKGTGETRTHSKSEVDASHRAEVDRRAQSGSLASDGGQLKDEEVKEGAKGASEHVGGQKAPTQREEVKVAAKSSALESEEEGGTSTTTRVDGWQNDGGAQGLAQHVGGQLKKKEVKGENKGPSSQNNMPKAMPDRAAVEPKRYVGQVKPQQGLAQHVGGQLQEGAQGANNMPKVMPVRAAVEPKGVKGFVGQVKPQWTEGPQHVRSSSSQVVAEPKPLRSLEKEKEAVMSDARGSSIAVGKHPSTAKDDHMAKNESSSSSSSSSKDVKDETAKKDSSSSSKDGAVEVEMGWEKLVEREKELLDRVLREGMSMVKKEKTGDSSGSGEGKQRASEDDDKRKETNGGGERAAAYRGTEGGVVGGTGVKPGGSSSGIGRTHEKDDELSQKYVGYQGIQTGGEKVASNTVTGSSKGASIHDKRKETYGGERAAASRGIEGDAGGTGEKPGGSNSVVGRNHEKDEYQGIQAKADNRVGGASNTVPSNKGASVAGTVVMESKMKGASGGGRVGAQPVTGSMPMKRNEEEEKGVSASGGGVVAGAKPKRKTSMTSLENDGTKKSSIESKGSSKDVGGGRRLHQHKSEGLKYDKVNDAAIRMMRQQGQVDSSGITASRPIKFSDCSPADNQTRTLRLGFAMDYSMFSSDAIGLSRTKAVNYVMGLASKANFAYFYQLNVLLKVGTVVIQERPSGKPRPVLNDATACGKSSDWNTCFDINGTSVNSIEDFYCMLNRFTNWQRGPWCSSRNGCDYKNVATEPQAWQLLFNCWNPWGIVGLTWQGTLGGNWPGITGISHYNSIHWVTVAHELGHTLGAWHSPHGGIMNWMMQPYNNLYQFEPTESRRELCNSVTSKIDYLGFATPNPSSRPTPTLTKPPSPSRTRPIQLYRICSATSLETLPPPSTLRIACSTTRDTITSVVLAIYGVGATCPTLPTICYTNITDLVSYMCIGKASCLVPTSSNALGGDPCQGLRKTVGVTAVCARKVPTPIPTVPPWSPLHFCSTTTNTSHLTLSCSTPQWLIASISSAYYGAPSSCPTPQNDPSSSNCTSQDVRLPVWRTCVGRTSCILTASPANLGRFPEPCASSRVLAVAGSCVPPYARRSRVSAYVLEPGPVNISCPSPNMIFSRLLSASYGHAPTSCFAPPRPLQLGLDRLTLGRNSARFLPTWPSLYLTSDPCPQRRKALNLTLECLTSHLTLIAPPTEKSLMASAGWVLGHHGLSWPAPPLAAATAPLLGAALFGMLLLFIYMYRRRVGTSSRSPAAGGSASSQPTLGDTSQQQKSRFRSSSFRLRLPKSLSKRALRSLLPGRFLSDRSGGLDE